MSNKLAPTKEQLEDAYRKSYLLQTVGENSKRPTIRTSVPCEVVEREARRHGLTVREFVKKFQVVWLYNGFTGFHGEFEPIIEKKGKQSIEA